ncbi:MAG: cold shock domain-containing protein [Sneathiella sp.]
MSDRKTSKAVRKNITATVKFFDDAKGFGFVSPADGSPDAFIHISVLQDTSYSEFAEGMTILCDLVDGDRGPQVSAVHEPEEGVSASVVSEEVEIEGTVTNFTPENFYGFVTPDNGGGDVFIHTKMLERSEIELETFGVDTKVKCVVRRGLRGLIADSLEVL